MRFPGGSRGKIRAVGKGKIHVSQELHEFFTKIGKKGGRAAAKKMTAEQRRARASRAATSRWDRLRKG